MLQTGTGSGCLRVSVSWRDLSVLALKKGGVLFSLITFFCLCLLRSVSLFFFFFSPTTTFPQGTVQKERKAVGGVDDRERKGCLRR